MWHRLLTQDDNAADDLFKRETHAEPRLRFDSPPVVSLTTRVPEDVWGTPKQVPVEDIQQERLAV